MSHTRIAVVTGANKGIGFAIVRQLALEYPKSKLNNGPLLVYLTARDRSRGLKALEELRSDPLLQQHKALTKDGGLTDVEYLPLDISDDGSIDAFAKFVAEKHPDGVDIVINNAAVALDGFNGQIVMDTMKINYYGTIAAMNAFLPLFRAEGRLVNVSSSAGKLHHLTPATAKRFTSANTIKDVTSIVQDFQDAVDAGRQEEAGFKSAAYLNSKVALNAATRIIAREQSEKGNKVLINCCNPGYVNTDMSKGNGTKTPDAGAETPVYLALGEIGGRTGLYWDNKQVEDF